MTTSKTDLEGSIKELDGEIDNKMAQKTKTPKITYTGCSQTRRSSTFWNLISAHVPLHSLVHSGFVFRHRASK